jgi:hypothetical protein
LPRLEQASISRSQWRWLAGRGRRTLALATPLIVASEGASSISAHSPETAGPRSCRKRPCGRAPERSSPIGYGQGNGGWGNVTDVAMAREYLRLSSLHDLNTEERFAMPFALKDQATRKFSKRCGVRYVEGEDARLQDRGYAILLSIVSGEMWHGSSFA